MLYSIFRCLEVDSPCNPWKIELQGNLREHELNSRFSTLISNKTKVQGYETLENITPKNFEKMRRTIYARYRSELVILETHLEN